MNKEKLDAKNAAVEAAKAENEKEATDYAEELSKKAKALTAEQERLNQQINDFSVERSKLGIFSFGAKKDLDRKIAATKAELQRVVDESKAFTEENMNNGDPKAVIRAKLPDIIEKINSDFYISESPMEAFERQRVWNEKKATYKAEGGYSGDYKYYIMSIAEYADELSIAQYVALIQKCFGCEVWDQRVTAYVRCLVNEGLLKRKVCDGYNLYSANR